MLRIFCEIPWKREFSPKHFLEPRLSQFQCPGRFKNEWREGSLNCGHFLLGVTLAPMALLSFPTSSQKCKRTDKAPSTGNEKNGIEPQWALVTPKEIGAAPEETGRSGAFISAGDDRSSNLFVAFILIHLLRRMLRKSSKEAARFSEGTTFCLLGHWIQTKAYG